MHAEPDAPAGSTGADHPPRPGVAWPHRERVKVRYVEVDAQQVVFNAHYLTWCDVASASWAEAAAGWTGVGDPVDWMVVRAVIEWRSSAAYGDTVDIDCGVSRWGTRSFDATYLGTVDGRPVFEATLTYVTIDPATKTSVPVPDSLRSGLGEVPT